MGAPKIIVPPAPVLPMPPDQSAIAVQQFGAMFRRRAAAGYASTFPQEAERGAGLPFHTDTIPAGTPESAPAPTGGTAGVPRPTGTDVVVDPSTGLPTEVPHVMTPQEKADFEEAARTAYQERIIKARERRQAMV